MKNAIHATQEETIRMYRMQGKEIKDIADMFECSVGLIYKVISEKMINRQIQSLFIQATLFKLEFKSYDLKYIGYIKLL